jgi:hypothetical protein
MCFGFCFSFCPVADPNYKPPTESEVDEDEDEDEEDLRINVEDVRLALVWLLTGRSVLFRSPVALSPLTTFTSCWMTLRTWSSPMTPWARMRRTLTTRTCKRGAPQARARQLI